VRTAALVVLAACGGATVTGTAMAPPEPLPEHITDHHHEAPQHAADTSQLYVEVTSDGDHGDVLRQSAAAGLGAVSYARPVADGGDVELHVELAVLAPASDMTTCKVRIFVLRLPQHDLLAIADGGARATGAAQADTCLSAVGTAIVREKLPVLLQRQLDAKK
jgi:hypothetical protein